MAINMSIQTVKEWAIHLFMRHNFQTEPLTRLASVVFSVRTARLLMWPLIGLASLQVPNYLYNLRANSVKILFLDNYLVELARVHQRPGAAVWVLSEPSPPLDRANDAGYSPL